MPAGPRSAPATTMADTPADRPTVPTCKGCWTTSAPGRLMSSSSTRSTVLWLDEIVSGSATNIEQIATRQKCSVRQVNMTISLAFLAPDLVKAAVEGRLPRGIGVERLRDAPAEWSRQFEALGLNPQ